jgi:hypothetical protein
VFLFMEKTYVDGKTVNVRTKHMLDMWQFNALHNFYVIQGSYNSGVGASAGTHDGGGALDLSVSGVRDVKWAVKQGRLAGFAAWYRPTYPGLWSAHIHAIAIGDADLSSGARAQVAEYYAGQDGLAGYGKDPDPRVHPIRVWPKVRLKRVSLLVAWSQFRAKKPAPRVAVKRIQWVLNEKLGTSLPIDGVAGPLTRAAYKRWEVKCGAPEPDGIPGPISLRKLGKGRFKASVHSWEKLPRNK